MDEIKTRLTDDAVAECMLVQLANGYTAPELAHEWLVYIKLNQLENKLETKKPIETIDRVANDRYLVCPNCNRTIGNVVSSRVYEPQYCHYCGQALKWIKPPRSRFA